MGVVTGKTKQVIANSHSMKKERLKIITHVLKFHLTRSGRA